MARFTRRGLLGASASAAAAAGAQAALPAGGPASADDEAYWAAVAAQYDLSHEVVQLENGNWGVMARPVQAAYERYGRMVNRRGSYYARREYGAAFEAVRARIAANLGVDAGEIVLTRGATEALLALISGYNRLRPGDAVLYADLDYDSMQSAMRWLRERRGVDVVRLDLPEPATRANLIAAYEAALEANPRVRMMLLTQVSHRNGLHLPVAEISALARARGVDVILDAAHAWGQAPIDLASGDCDFVGLNGHKWIGAPIGVGVLYIRRNRIEHIDPYMGADDYRPGDIRLRAHTGTADHAVYLAMADALDLHESIGVSAKAARLAYLRERWMAPARAIPGVEVLTSDPALGSALGAFRLRGKTSPEDNVALARRLLEAHGVFTVARHGLASGSCVRATVGLFTAPADADRLVTALAELAA